MKNEIDAAVKALSGAGDDNLYARLGAYSVAFPLDPANFAAPHVEVAIDAAVAGPLDDAIELGRRILQRWNRVLHDLVCGEAGDPQAKAALNAALLKSPEALAASITSLLIGVFSVGPAIAAIVGVLLGRVLLPAAGREICDFWAERL
jgi:hypothetical protein